MTWECYKIRKQLGVDWNALDLKKETERVFMTRAVEFCGTVGVIRKSRK
jgi:hypothetical protein